MGGLGLEPDRSLGQIERLLGPTGYLLLWRNDSEGKSPSETPGKSDRRGEYDTINRRIDKSYIYIFIDIHTHTSTIWAAVRVRDDQEQVSLVSSALPLFYTLPRRLLSWKCVSYLSNFPSFKEASCEFNLLQEKVLWLSAACAFSFFAQNWTALAEGRRTSDLV